jgi:hypothetical protein
MKVNKTLVKVSENNGNIKLIHNSYYLYILGKYGINYLLINDTLFIKALEYCIFYNQLGNRNNLVKHLILHKIKSSNIGWFIELNIIGLGFRAKLLDIGYLLLNLGYSHAFAIKIFKGINILLNKDKILLFSLDLILLGKFVNNIINLRPMDVYKGKGIKVLLKEIKLKEGKKQKL